MFEYLVIGFSFMLLIAFIGYGYLKVTNQKIRIILEEDD